MNKLVVYYSRAKENYFGGQYRTIETGNTEIVARYIAEATNAALFHIEQKEPYSANYKKCTEQALQDKRANARPELKRLPENLNDFDEIYLGYPNYWGDMPMAVYTFLEACNWQGKTIHPFCTHEGSGMSNTPEKIRSLCPGASVTNGLAIRGSDADKSKAAVQNWIKEITK